MESPRRTLILTARDQLVTAACSRLIGDPFGIACLWDRWTDPTSGELVVSFSMLTVNADEHPVMNQFHKPEDEKRTPVIIAPELHDTWLSADPAQAAALMNWSHMPKLRAMSAPKA